ncbi:unnamed protein product [Cylindrotheca closterium]|uniref:Chromatin-remodeling complex ATPase chain n=1 Tax=Cylindrotheca closterium TaxID=2856 RepID=A0AAD2FXJ4_9STRA|nr:unnamed protein product [Cylindrotheca closterium]
MPKEDRSDWVAVAPEFAASIGDKIKPVTSAYQYFQKDISEQVKAELGKGFKVYEFGRAVKEKWNNLDDDEREHYEQLCREDKARFARESHAADIAAIERRERLQRERDMLMLDDEGGVRRTTRGVRAKKERKKARKDKRGNQRHSKTDRNMADNQEFVDDDDDESSDSYSAASDSDSEGDSDGNGRPKKKKAVKPKPQMSEKQIEYRRKIKEEKQQKEQIIAARQEDVRKEKASQAKRRLEFLLKQSNIFSHFGQVKQDTAKYGIKTAVATKNSDDTASSRRDAGDDDDDLEEADESRATFLTAQPTTIGFGKMRQYQLEGLNWMVRLQENGVNGILADEMGLGKTLQSISVLVYMLEYQNSTGPHLIVVPKSTLSNWMNEIKRWAPTLSAVKFHGDKTAREELANNVLCPGQHDSERTWNVCVTTYEVCNIDKNVLNKFAWSYLIIDEAHRLKNEASTFSVTIRTFETRYRLLLTGTPLQNSLHELWALLNFLVPDVFANAEQFDEWFNLDIEDNDEKNKLISQLHKILRPFMLRRLKKEVEKSLPPKHETILYTGMSAMQKKLYRDILIRDIDAVQGTTGNRTAILNIVMQLRKCAGHPYLFPGVEDRTLPPLGEHLVENCGKMVLLDKLLKRLHERGHRVLLFTQMTRILDIMEDYLVMRRFKYCRIDGNTTYEVREDYIDAFNKPDSEKFIFLLSTRAGGLGINLQTADVVILYDSDWNPQADLQAQDRAHRIGQKREVQVFRFVTEHTVEEKIVERAQQKLKLDAMVVQQGRLKEKDKLSRDELLEAVRFGADKIFKSKDSSITDADIDMILDAGKRKTQELNEKLKAADKGDLLDFKLDGNSNLQTFEGVDYSSNVLAQARKEAELLHIIDMGKRERRTVANYNENKLYQEQMAAMQGKKVERKRKIIKLPKEKRLPRMEEWQMFKRDRLIAIQEQEEAKFRSLPEEVQKLEASSNKASDPVDSSTGASATNGDGNGAEGKEEGSKPTPPLEVPPLLDEETQAEKDKLLSEGFATWRRPHYSAFVKASGRYGRSNYAQIAADVGKSEAEVKEYADAFWGPVGKERFSEHEYDRVVKLIEKGEKKILEIASLERCTKVLVSLFENPWEELEYQHVTTKDKLFSADNDRFLLCWAHKFGYGQWGAVKMAIRRSPKFRFDYFMRSLPMDVLGRRCEHLMRAAEKEVEHLEKNAREEAGLPVEAPEGGALPPVQLPSFKEMQRIFRQRKREQTEQEKIQLERKVEELETEMKNIQDRLKELNSSGVMEVQQKTPSKTMASRKRPRSSETTKEEEVSGPNDIDESKGTIGPEGEFLEFPEYDGVDPPKEPKKAFTHFCVSTRKTVKAALDPTERKNKEKIHEILREKWMNLPDEEKLSWRKWATWDKKRFARDMDIHESKKKNGTPKADDENSESISAEHDLQVTKKKIPSLHVPKKKRLT